ncbi:MAG: bifunctional 4-hydroxy-3-methylbut-2-enyl diphosphate reductase/30S ribosomal protein S1 [Anaerovoracaceae bacterium]|jgi:(E)-4-hydroxy-3-methyl-but-2-enyl pyrophosphate reductase
MMTESRIIRAKHSGFCFGVKEALRKAEETIREYEGRKVNVYTCGPIIHNKSVVAELEERGVGRIDTLQQASKGDVVVIRSHGEPKIFYDEAFKKGITLVDATCPFVLRIHRLVEKAAEEGRNVVIVGDRKHPEVIAISGWADDRATVISNVDEAQSINFDKITMVAQTTIALDLWDDVTAVVLQKGGDVQIFNTICNATSERQNSCGELARESDILIVIGDRLSANTNKLYQKAKRYCEKVYFVERKEELPLKEIERCNRIGVAAGASTPERIIKEVISTMSEFITDKEQNVDTIDEVAEKDSATEEIVEESVSEGNEVIQEESANETVLATDEETESAAAEEVNQMQDLMDQIEKSLRLPGRGEVVDGEVVQVTNKYVVVNLGCKKDGIIPKEEMTLEGDQELTELLKEGDPIQAKVIKNDDGDGNILLSKRKLEVNEHWDEINLALDNKTVVNAKVVKEVKGGVIAVYKEVAGFIPMSQLSDRYVEKADEFVGKILPVKVSRVDQKRNKAVFSHKAYLAEEKQKRIQEIWDSLNVGDNVEGTVMRFTDYGAFVDIGGIDGLLHISEISWGKLKHPQEALEIGQKINVKILSRNDEKGKISLGLKQNQPEPWSIIEEKYQVGQVIEGKVVQIKEYGAFVELEPGLDGLVHISEIAFKRVTNVADELSLGQIVQTKILEIEKDRKRISLSIKETLDNSILGKDDTDMDYPDEAAEETDVPEVEEAPVAENTEEDAGEAVFDSDNNSEEE